MQTVRRREQVKDMDEPQTSSVFRHISAIAVPGMYLYYKYYEFKRQRKEDKKRKVTEKELDHLNQKIDRLLAKLEEKDSTHDFLNDTPDDECVICLASRATMRTFPCGHKVVCRRCFIKTIQNAVSQRCLPLKCVVCREKILKLRQSEKVRNSSKKTIKKSLRHILATRGVPSAKVYQSVKK